MRSWIAGTKKAAFVSESRFKLSDEDVPSSPAMGNSNAVTPWAAVLPALSLPTARGLTNYGRRRAASSISTEHPRQSDYGRGRNWRRMTGNWRLRLRLRPAGNHAGEMRTCSPSPAKGWQLSLWSVSQSRMLLQKTSYRESAIGLGLPILTLPKRDYAGRNTGRDGHGR